MVEAQLLKKDLFGEVWRRSTREGSVILRETRMARWWIRWLARALMRREARVLAVLEGLNGVPELHSCDRHRLVRGYVDGSPMHISKPGGRAYYRDAARLLRRMHGRGVVHNDLAKEPNLLVRDDGTAAFIDFQLAWYAPRRGRLFRTLAREDLRHLLKHKRTYCPDELTARENNILATPAALSRAWMSFVKPVYLFVTRRMLGWSDREGAGDRGQQT